MALYKRLRLPGIMCLGLIFQVIYPSAAGADISVNGFGETGYYPRFDKPDKPVIDQQRMRLNVSDSHGPFRLKVWSEARRNDSGELRPEWELLVPEIYGEYQGTSFFARVGKQQIVWGAADGLFINDIVNPLDLREFLLPDLDNIHMAQPSARIQYNRSNWLVEGVWIAKFAETKIPDIMKETSTAEMLADVTIPVVSSKPGKPPATVENSEFGVRLSGLIGQWDVAVNYLRCWYDLPVYRGNVIVDNTGAPSLILSPFYQRISTWGGSFSRPVGSILLRGEFSYIPNLLFGTNDPDASSMVTGQNFLNYFIGIDIMVQKARVGFQFAQEKIFGDARLINRTDTDTVATVMIERTFLRDSLQCLIFADREFDQNDLWVRAEIGYRINSRVKCMFGSHSFTGNKTGRLGQFHDWNSFFMKIRYSFSA